MSLLLIRVVNRLGCESAKADNSLTYKKISVLAHRLEPRTLALGLAGRGWHGRRGRAAPRPAERQHDEEPEESQQSELVGKQV